MAEQLTDEKIETMLDHGGLPRDARLAIRQLRAERDEAREEILRLRARVAELETAHKPLLTFYRLMVAEKDARDLDEDTFDHAVAAGCLVKYPGGFDPEKHDDDGWGAEPGDDWFVPSPAICALFGWTLDVVPPLWYRP